METIKELEATGFRHIEDKVMHRTLKEVVKLIDELAGEGWIKEGAYWINAEELKAKIEGKGEEKNE